MTNSHNFLQGLAQKCKSQFDDQCDRLTVIFPNKRAGVYFADYLAQLYDRPIWSPIILSFEEFVEQKQEKNYADDLQMIFLLYKAYKEIVKQPEDFDAFFPWGEMILKDYNDIDNYLVDVAHIFRVIKSQKELDEAFQHLSEKDQQTIQSFWKGFLPTPNKKQNEFIATWSILAELYEKFNVLLAADHLIYKGRMFRHYSEHILPLDSESTLWFAGFNALTKAEEKIIKAYLDAGNCDVFWDVDRYYFDDANQESGSFFREYAQDEHFKESITRDLKQTIDQESLQFQVMSAPFSMGQIRGAAQHIEQLSLSHAEQSEVLVVLTDESLLQSTLNALPPSIEHANVTMGWPIAQSRIYLLLSKINALHDKYQDSKIKKVQHKELLQLLEFNDLLGIEYERVSEFHATAIQSNRVYQSTKEVADVFPELALVLASSTSTQELLSNLISFLKELSLDTLSDLDRSVVPLIHGTLKRIDTAIRSHGVSLSTSSFNKLFLKLGNTIKLPLSGDHNKGIQVMGILETRNLSFKHVLIIGMNEGSWPKDSANTSFIPYNIRKAFDLPTTEHQDAMQSYLFYRLLHSAENLWVSYNNISEFNHNGELSRYVRQLDYESKLSIQTANLVNPISAETQPVISVAKDEAVMSKLRQFIVSDTEAFKRLSPSALNTYVDCKLKFYFQHIEKIREPDELLEDMDPSLFGNLLHGAMEHLYTGQTEWQVDDVSNAKKSLDLAIKQSFEDQKLTENNEATGRQLIAYEVIKAYMERILAFDQQHAPFHILGLEATDYFVDFPIETLDGSVKIGLKGIIDRIDEYGEVVRVLDYKSGRDERKFALMFDLIDGKSNKRNKAVFQLFYYCMLYKENHPEIKRPIQPGLFNSKDLFDDKFDALLTQTIDRKNHVVWDYADYEEQFKDVLLYLLTEMFNPTVPFSQTEDEQKCQYCAYRQICNK